MSTQTITSKQVIPAASPQTARLLSGGIVAGALFLAVWALQAFTRDGFDVGRTRSAC